MMASTRSNQSLVLLACCLLLASGCSGSEEGPLTTEVVDLVLHTTQCPPEEEPKTHFFTPNEAPLTTLRLQWDVLCVRDNSDIQWWAVRVTDWEDRSEDLWNLWYIDPEVRELRYGEAQVAGGVDINNTDYPFAMEKVPPRPLPSGDYRVEVWGILAEYLDSQWGEVRLTVED